MLSKTCLHRAPDAELCSVQAQGADRRWSLLELMPPQFKSPGRCSCAPTMLCETELPKSSRTLP